MLDQLGKIDNRKFFIGIGRPIKFAETADNAGCIFGRRAQHFETAARFRFVVEHCFVLQEDVGETENRHQGVVEVVRDARRHLAKRAQAFLLDHLLLSRLEFDKRFLEFPIYFV